MSPVSLDPILVVVHLSSLKGICEIGFFVLSRKAKLWETREYEALQTKQNI